MSAEFFDRLEEISDWTRYRVYVYRTWPVLIKSNPHYVASVSQAIGPDYLLGHFGSGSYLLMLNDRKAQKLVAKHTISVYDEDKPPRLNPLHLVRDDPSNDVYFETWGATTKARPSEGPSESATGDSAAAEAIRELATIVKQFQAQERELDSEQRDLVMHAAREAIDVVKSQYSERESSGSTPAQIIELLAKAKELIAPPASDAKQQFSSELALFKEMRGLFQQLLETRAESAPQQNGLQQVQEMVGLIKSLQDTFGSRSGEPKWWEAALPLVPQALGQVGNIVQGVAAMRLAAPGSPTSPPPQQNRYTGGRSQSGSPAALPHVSQAGREDGAPAPAAEADPRGDATAAEINVSQEQVLQFLGVVAGPLVNYLNQGAGGDEFAGWMIDGFGQVTYETIAGFGKDGLLEALQTHPALWAELSKFKRLERFIDEFLSGPPNDEDADRNLQTPAPAQSPEST